MVAGQIAVHSGVQIRDTPLPSLYVQIGNREQTWKVACDRSDTE